MSKALSTMLIFFVSSPLLAALGDEAAGASAPSETVSIVYVILFGIIFVGMIVGFFVYLWWLERKKPTDEQ